MNMLVSTSPTNLRPGGELVLLDEEDIHGTMGFINSEQTLKSGSQGVIKTPISLPVTVQNYVLQVLQF